MRIAATSFAAALALPAAAQEEPKGAPSPNAIVAAAPTQDWVAIAPADLLVMTLAPDRDGNKRQVVIQLMPPPFSQGWIGNIRKLAAAHWWDGLAITRVQDNYVVQWGDPDGEDKAKAKALPPRLATSVETDYALDAESVPYRRARYRLLSQARPDFRPRPGEPRDGYWHTARDPYTNGGSTFDGGWPLAYNGNHIWPIHCYGMVGVGRNYSPDTGSGAELYTVIGHAPRHLDRNIALVGRVVEGIEHLSSLPRGTGPLGFYEKAEQRVPIVSIRLSGELPDAGPASSSGSEAGAKRQPVGQQTQPRFEYLSTESESFAKYADARANRRDPFFIVPAGGADICNIPVPVRRVGK